MLAQAIAFEIAVFLKAGLREQALSSTRQFEALAERTKNHSSRCWRWQPLPGSRWRRAGSKR